MKKIVLIVLTLMPAFIQSQNQNLMSDSASYCVDTEGYTTDVYDILGNTAAVYNGNTYFFNFIESKGPDPNAPPYSNGCPRVYTYYHDELHPMDVRGGNLWWNEDHNYWKSCITYFGYPDENSYCPALLSKVFTFQFNGLLWYGQNISAFDDKSWYECYAQMPVQEHDSCRSYYLDRQIASDKSIWPKVAAFQMDTCLYFLSQKVTYKNYSTYAPTWALEKCWYNAKLNQFVPVENYSLNITHGGMLCGLIRRYDPVADSDYMLISTYDQQNIYFYNLKIGKSSYQLTYLKSFAGTNAWGGVSVMPGSIQGCRTPSTSNIAEPAYSDRLTIFSIFPYKSGSDYSINYYEEFFDGSGAIQHIGGAVLLNPLGGSPMKMNDLFSLTGTYTLTPHHYTDKLSNSSTYYDGYKQTIWLFFPDPYHRDFFSVGLNSDIWQPSPSSADTVFTSDLSTDTADIATQLQTLSTLLGIVDGAPPCSVDWEKWDAAYPPGTSMEKEPTFLELSESVTKSIEFTNTTSDEFSEAANIKISKKWKIKGIPVTTEVGVGAKFSQAFSSIHSTGTETTYTQSTEFGLTGEVQGEGNYLWAIPTITRYVYRRYPWYDGPGYGSYQYQVPNSMQFLFRTTGMKYIKKSAPVSGYPFRVADPNGTELYNWRLNLNDGRKGITQTLNLYTFLSKLTSSTWNWPGTAVNGSFESLVDTTQTNESEYSFDFKVSGGVQVSKVFKLNVSTGYNISYSNETKTESTFGKDIKLNINLTSYDQPYINNKNSLYIDLYLFKASDSIPYWYWDSIPASQQKPWYIAYVISSASKKISLLSPDDHYNLQRGESIFNWTAENMESATFNLVIASSWPATPRNVVYSEQTDGRTSASPAGFVPQPGKTYYWAVRGSDPSGEVIWSDPRSFTIPVDAGPAVAENDMKVIIYPNPATNDKINISFQGVKQETVILTIYSPSGNPLFIKKLEYSGSGVMNTVLNDLGLTPGIFLAGIHSGSGQVMKKLVITDTP
jgi:hypothetical protein